jgi:hypothetical protein
MPTTDYITLTTSGSSEFKRFKAIQMKTPIDRTDNIDRTAGGKTDKQAGTIIQRWQYALRVPLESALTSGSDYGLYSNLVAFYYYNNPNGNPSDKFILTDHFGVHHQVIFVGDLSPEPIATILEGDSAWYVVQTSFEEVL